MRRRTFLKLGAAAVAVHGAGMGATPQQGKEETSMYSVVRIIVKSTREYCPFYKPGDTFFIRQQCFDPTSATPKQFCMHSLNDIYETYMQVRKGALRNKKTVGCMDEAIVQFEVERLPDEEGPGWNRPRADHQ